MTVQIDWPSGWKLDSALEALAAWLQNKGFEVNRERSGWRVMMFRKE